MFVLENFNRSSCSSLDIQGFQDKSDGTEKTFDYLESSSNEVDEGSSVESAFKKLNSYCKAQGGFDNDMVYWDGQVREMMETVKKIREKLPARTRVDDIFNFCEEGAQKNVKLPLSEEDLKASLAEIEKMDVVLKIKGTEEKKAKLSRIQAEEEARSVLSKLPSLQSSKGFQSNCKEFMRLLNDDGNESGSPSSKQVDECQQEKQQQNENKTKTEKIEKSDSEQEKGASCKFVDRNIRLAKCGRGTLSTTEEENSRLEKLLGELENSSAESKEDPNEEDSYGIDCETKSVLRQIDQQLEALRTHTWGPKYYLSVLEKNIEGEKFSEEEEKTNPSKKAKREKSPNRLEEINRLLDSMNSVSKEEITPLSQKEIANLVQQSKRNLSQRKKSGAEENSMLAEIEWVEMRPPKAVIADLVSAAKFLMPKFKYRFV